MIAHLHIISLMRLLDADIYDSWSETDILNMERKWLLQQKQSALWKCDFWKSTFDEVINRYNFQEDYYLVGKKPNKNDLDIYFHRLFKKLETSYNLCSKRITRNHEIEFTLTLGYYTTQSSKSKHVLASEISLRLHKNDISLSILPYNFIDVSYYLDDYLVVEKVITDLCQELFSSPVTQITEFINFRESINAASRLLNKKSIDIARSSIKSLCLASSINEEQLTQGYLYSEMNLGNEKIFIFHQDFLDNPKILINKLESRK